MRAEPGRDKYPHVFAPLAIGPVEVRNRIYIPPHGTSMEAPVPGYSGPGYNVPAAQAAHYFAERAAGGVALIFESMQVGPSARQQPYVAISPWLPEAVPSFARVAELVHEQGAKIMAEIWYSTTRPSPWEVLGPEAPTFGASQIQHWMAPSVRYEMRKPDIRRLLGEYAQTARHLRQAGFDGIELHASHGILMEHFISPYFNHRTDEYGGSLENRLRFLKEALETVRGEISGEMAVGMRITVDQLLPGGNTQEDVQEILAHMPGTGLLHFVDLDISVEPRQGNLMTTSFFEPKLHNAERVANVRAAAGPLVVLATPGRLTNIAEAEMLVARGIVDMAGAVRGLIAEPDLVQHALDGHEERSRTCIAANHCLGGVGFGCALNAAVGREEKWGRSAGRTAPRRMKVVVVGGGPAGLEAARVAAGRGHRVVLLERRQALGGGLALWARLPGREHLTSTITWFERRLAEHRVDVRTGVDADENAVLVESPEVVVLATGAQYARGGQSGFEPQPIPGWDRPFVHTPEDVLADGASLAGTVVVLDDEGLHTGAGVAELAARRGAQVELVSRKAFPAADLATNHQLPYVAARLRETGVAVSTGTYIREIGDGSVTLIELATGRLRVVENVDAVVLATMRLVPPTLQDSLEERVEYVYRIGDALAPRGLREATYEGHRFARVIGEPDMPPDVIAEAFRPIEPLRAAEYA
jgi:2,4-dienoyl-CoA reductase-like NADH-dependent reductase (Old Yellow Enzyme family)/NADPH-dependent 2,4-dienoyl-CoA reductase/sulfur reductase-like enzyme